MISLLVVYFLLLHLFFPYSFGMEFYDWAICGGDFLLQFALSYWDLWAEVFAQYFAIVFDWDVGFLLSFTLIDDYIS